jgi:hypothetical protein
MLQHLPSNRLTPKQDSINNMTSTEFISKIKTYNNKAAFRLLLELNEKELLQLNEQFPESEVFR